MEILTHKKIDNHLRSRGWTGGAVLYHELVVYFEDKGERFNLMNYSTLSLRDVCEKVGYYWMKNNERDNFILELDSTIGNLRRNT